MPQRLGAGANLGEYIRALLKQQAGALNVLHLAFALGAIAVFTGHGFALAAGLVSSLEQARALQAIAQRLSVADRRQIDSTPRLNRQAGEIRLLAFQRFARRPRLAQDLFGQ